MKLAGKRCYQLGLIGYPLGHSVSPILHQAALKSAALEGVYQLFPIPPTQEGLKELETLFSRLRRGELDGVNVTIPHKQNVQPFLDRLSPTAAAVRAVNTIYMDESGQLTGENTDVPGFLRDLSRLIQRKDGKAVVLGAGGSARAIVYALSQAGWEVCVLARRVDQAQSLAEEFSQNASHMVQSGLLEQKILEKYSPDCQLLVNTTPVGMVPNSAGCPWPDEAPLPRNTAVYDLIYNPLQTRLLQRARQENLPGMNGAGMLSAQAALAFAHWTGLEPPFEVMEQAFPQHL